MQIFSTYKNTYIATITQADVNRTLRILKTAHEYPGPALVLAYSPCISHKAKTFNSQQMMKNAEHDGLFPLVELDPRRKKGDRLHIDSVIDRNLNIQKEGRIVDYDKLEKFVASQTDELR